MPTDQARRTDALRSALDRTDWSFPGTGTDRDSIHAIHWFPGNFIPQIPSFLIQLLSRPGDVVLDPFCGSGTSLVEAFILGRHGVGADTNRAALQVTASKSAILQHGNAVRPALLNASDALTWEPLVFSEGGGSHGEGTAAELIDWFHAETLGQLRGIWKQVVEKEEGPARLVLETLFTDTLFACASSAGTPTRTGGARRHHWGWIADNVTPTVRSPKNAVAAFSSRLARLSKILKYVPQGESGTVNIACADARNGSFRDAVADLVVTSPPYLAMIDYTLASRLTFLWFGWPLKPAQLNEIGARYRRGRQDVVKQYNADVMKSVAEIRRILRPGGYCALVIGASRKFPEATDMSIAAFASELDLVWGPVSRQPSRQRVTERRDREANEVVCVFQKSE